MGKKPLTPERKAHLARLKKASRLRAKAEKGSLTDSERQELQALESVPKAKGGRPRGAVTSRREADDAEPVAPVVAESDGDQGQEPPPRQEPPPPPPAVEVMPPKTKGGGGDWRNRYREEAVGREAACVQMAAMYCGILKRMSKYISDAGVTPIMGDAEIDSAVFGAAVLTADKLLPDVDFGPEVQLALGSGLVMSQAMYVAMKKRRMGKGAAAPAQTGPTWTAPANPAEPGPATPPIPQTENSNGSIAVGNVRVPSGSFF